MALSRVAGRDRFRGWRLRQLCVAAGIHFRDFPEAGDRGIRLVAGGGLAGLRHRRDDGCGLLAVAGTPAGPGAEPGASSCRAWRYSDARSLRLALLTPHLWHLYAIFAILGAVGNGTAHLAYTRAVSTWFDRHRGMALALVMTGGAVGAIVLPPAAQALIGNLGWRGAFATLGAMVLAIGLPVVAPLIRERPGYDRERREEAGGASVAQAMRSRAFWILVVVLFLFSIGQNGAITHLSALLTDRGVSSGDAAIAVSLMGAASLLGRLVTGWLLDRFFAPRLAFCLLSLAALGIFILSGAHSLAAGSIAAILIGVGMGGEADITPYLLSRYFGLRSFSMLYGFSWTAYAIAGAIGPVLMGRAFDTSASYQALAVKLSVLTLFAAALMLGMPAYRAYEGRSMAAGVSK